MILRRRAGLPESGLPVFKNNRRLTGIVCRTNERSNCDSAAVLIRDYKSAIAGRTQDTAEAESA